MSVPRTLSLSGLLVALACSLAACGSKQSPSTDAAAATTATTPAAAGGPASPIKKINLTAHDPKACDFLSPADVAKILPSIKKSHGIPTACTYTDTKADSIPSIGFLYLSKGLIQQSILSGPDKTQTVRHAWDEQKEAAKKASDYTAVNGLGDSAYGQLDPVNTTVRWFIKDHAFYLHYNFSSKVPAQKTRVTIKDLVKLAKMVPDPDTLPHS